MNNKENCTWHRDERVYSYISQRRARYASITRATNGRLLILFTHQTEEQERAGSGDLYLIRRTRDGDWWFYPKVVYEGGPGEPRANGTMTTLRSGTIITPFVMLTEGEQKSTLQMLISKDDGKTWHTGEPILVDPLVWAAPYGRIIERDNELLMPVYGALSKDDLIATRLCCGLLRSRDGGTSWSEWTAIAGPDPDSRVSYEFASVLELTDKSLVAIVTERQLKNRPQLPLDLPLALVRAYSEDGGKSWSKPEHMCVGSWPSLTAMDDKTVACSFTVYAGWGQMLAMFSDDGFRTIRHRLYTVEHNWLPNLPTSEWGGTRSRNPLPNPPVVPNLKGEWRHGHFGFSSALALDADTLIVAIGQMQRGSSYSDIESEYTLPLELERIETITSKRVLLEPGTPAVPKTNHDKPKGQWYLAERWSFEEWRAKTGQSPDDVSIELKSGRWIKTGGEMVEPYKEGVSRLIGRERGYWVWKGEEGMHYTHKILFYYSDDQGKTWHDAVVEESPLAAATHLGGSLFEDTDGTLVCPVYGYFNHEEMAVSLYTNGLVRSHDKGKSWGDWSIIGYDKEKRYEAYSETQIQMFPDGTWVAFFRTEYRSKVPCQKIRILRSISTDKGRTWSTPEPTAADGVGAGLLLPDGGFALSSQNTCNWGLCITYNYGLTWNYALPATYANSRAGVYDENTIWFFDDDADGVAVYKRS